MVRARVKVNGLTPKQQRFIELYSGNATEAALKAGYSKKTAPFIGAENLKKPQIIEAIRKREEKELRPLIATRQDRQKFWTDVMNNADEDMKNRLKASELLGKSEADFTEKIQATGDMRVETVPSVDLSELSPEQLYEMTRALYGEGVSHDEQKVGGTD